MGSQGGPSGPIGYGGPWALWAIGPLNPGAPGTWGLWAPRFIWGSYPSSNPKLFFWIRCWMLGLGIVPRDIAQLCERRTHLDIKRPSHIYGGQRKVAIATICLFIVCLLLKLPWREYSKHSSGIVDLCKHKVRCLHSVEIVFNALNDPLSRPMDLHAFNAKLQWFIGV